MDIDTEDPDDYILCSQSSAAVSKNRRLLWAWSPWRSWSHITKFWQKVTCENFGLGRLSEQPATRIWAFKLLIHSFHTLIICVLGMYALLGLNVQVILRRSKILLKVLCIEQISNPRSCMARTDTSSKYPEYSRSISINLCYNEDYVYTTNSWAPTKKIEINRNYIVECTTEVLNTPSIV